MVDKVLLVSKDKNTVNKLKEVKFANRTVTKEVVNEEYNYVNEYTKCSYDNLKILVKYNEVAIIGSVRKYMAIQKNKDLLLYNPTISDLYDFCDAVESDLGIDISSMTVYQLECGVSSIVKHPIKEYLDTLFHLPRTHKNTFGNNAKKFSCSYHNDVYRATSLQFYDNAKLYGNNKENIIRIELAIPKRLKSRLKQKDAIVFEEFLSVDLWEDVYELMVRMINDIQTKRDADKKGNLIISTPNELKNFLCDRYLSDEDNYDTLAGFLIECKESNPEFDPVNIKRQISNIRQLQKPSTTVSDMKNELINLLTEEFNMMMCS
ncbi:MAG: hypothetical protein WC121_10940 [Candidatus Kapaibacterium sp.]